MTMLRSATLLLSLYAGALAYPNGAPAARLPTLGWSSWIGLGPNGQHPVFDYCDEASVKAAADAFIEVGLYDAGYRHLLVACTLPFPRAPSPRRPPCAHHADHFS